MPNFILPSMRDSEQTVSESDVASNITFCLPMLQIEALQARINVKERKGDSMVMKGQNP